MEVTNNITITNEDNMKMMSRYPDNYFDLAIVDPPYGIGEYWLKQKHTSHYGKKNWNERPPDRSYFDELFRVSKNQIIWGGNYFCHHLPITNSWIIWEKGNDVEKMNTSECEIAWTSFKVPMRKVFVQWSGARKGNETGIKCIHPCQRPVMLHEWTLMKYANEGDKILDTHLGSGSTAVACEKLGFELTACELDEKYFNDSVKRVKEESKVKTFFN